jgi:hypothetical protein
MTPLFPCFINVWTSPECVVDKTDGDGLNMEPLNEFDFSSPDFLESLARGSPPGSAASSSGAMPSPGVLEQNPSPLIVDVEKLSLEDPSILDNPGSTLD